MSKMNRETILLGKRLRAARLYICLSQEMVARRARISISFLSQLERGLKTPGLEIAHRLATVLGDTMDRVFYGPKR